MGIALQLFSVLHESKVPDDYATAKARRDELDAEVDRTGRLLKSISGGGSMGMTPETVRSTPKWKKANADYNSAFRALQAFNTVFVKRFKREIQQDRKRRLGG